MNLNATYSLKEEKITILESALVAFILAIVLIYLTLCCYQFICRYQRRL